MRLIDSKKLADRIEECWDWESLGPTMTNLLKATINEIRVAPEVKAIPKDWLNRELTEMIYERVTSGEVADVFHQLIARWEKENE